VRVASSDGLAVAPAVGALGQALAELLDLADVSFSLVGMSSDGEHGDVGGGVIKDQADRLGLGIPAGQGNDAGSIGFRPGPLGDGEALSGVLAEACRHDVGPVDLVADGAEVLADRAEVGTAADAVFHEPGGLRLVRIGPGA